MKSFLHVLAVGGALIYGIDASGTRGLSRNSTISSTKMATTSMSTTVTSMPNLPSTIATGNASMCSDDLGFEVYRGYTDAALRCYCASVFDSWLTTSNPPTRTVSTVKPAGSTTETITTASTTITTIVEKATSITATITGNDGGANGFDWQGTAVSPCCSSCVIAAQTVNIFYWPTPAIPSQATEFINPDGSTFKSPTVYLGFTSLSATDYCGNVGKVYKSTTFEFGPSELSTFGKPIVQTITTTTPFVGDDDKTTFQTTTETLSNRGLASILNYQDLGQNCSTISGYTYLAGNPLAAGDITYDPCHPTIVLPEQIRSADPAWASCINNAIGGFYDPPFALTSVAGELQPFSPSSATPAQTPQSDQAPSTSVQTTPPIVTTPPTKSALPPSSMQPPADPTNSPATSVSSVKPPADPTNSPATSISSIDPPASRPVSSSSPVQPASTPAQGPSQPPSSQTALPVIGSQTLSPGGPPITVSGTVLSLAPSGSSVIVNGGSSVPLTAVLPPSQTQIAIGSQTVVAGGPPITVSGTVFSLQSGGAVVVDGASTIPMGAVSVALSAPAMLNTKVLTPGGAPITLDGTAFSLLPTGSDVVVNGISTIPLVSANAIISSAAIVGSAETLVPGGSPVVVDGTTFSLEPTGGIVVENGASTIPLSSANAVISLASDAAIASAIASVMGLSATITTTSGGSTSSISESATSTSTSSLVTSSPPTGTSDAPNPTKTGSAVRVQTEAIWIALLGIFAVLVM